MAKRYTVAHLKPRGLKSVSKLLNRRATTLDNIAWGIEIAHPNDMANQIAKLRRIAVNLRSLANYFVKEKA